MARAFLGWLLGTVAALVIGAELQPDGVAGFALGFALPFVAGYAAWKTQPEPPQ